MNAEKGLTIKYEEKKSITESIIMKLKKINAK